MFPRDHINEISPLKHWMKDVASGNTPVFGVDHLDKPANSAAFLGVSRKSGLKDVFRPCLVLEIFEDSVYILIGSTDPRPPNRWVPLDGSQSLNGMPKDIMVKTVPNQAFKLPGRKGGYICFTHAFRVTPVLKHHSATPDRDVGITHIAPMNRPIQCLNASEILALHRLYWHGAPKLGSAEAQGDEGPGCGSGGASVGTGGGDGGDLEGGSPGGGGVSGPGGHGDGWSGGQGGIGGAAAGGVGGSSGKGAVDQTGGGCVDLAAVGDGGSGVNLKR